MTDTIQDFSSLFRMVALGFDITNVIAISRAKPIIPSGITTRV